jgi:hypothetical protein
MPSPASGGVDVDLPNRGRPAPEPQRHLGKLAALGLPDLRRRQFQRRDSTAVIPQNQIVVGMSDGRLELALRVLSIEAFDHASNGLCEPTDVVPDVFDLNVKSAGVRVDLFAETGLCGDYVHGQVVDLGFESVEPRLEAIDFGFDSLEAFHHCSIARALPS